MDDEIGVAAVVVEITNGGAASANVPIAVTFLDAAGADVGNNTDAGIDPTLNHIPSLAAGRDRALRERHDRLRSRRPTSAKVQAAAGAAGRGARPADRDRQGRREHLRAVVRGVVTNPGGKPAQNVRVEAVIRKGGKIVSAGTARVAAGRGGEDGRVRDPAGRQAGGRKADGMGAGGAVMYQPTKFNFDRPPIMRVWRRGCWYGKTNVVRDVTLHVSRGEILALIGPSGCGKTTFLRSLNRLLELTDGAWTEGVATLVGLDIERYSAESLRRRVGYVFQLPNPFPMSIYDNIARPMVEHRMAHSLEECRPTVDYVLDRVGLLRETKGRLERIRALALRRPAAAALHRPAARDRPGRDPPGRAVLRPRPALDRDDRAGAPGLKEEVAIVIVTHNLAQARRIADRVGFFLDGELVELAPSGQMFDAPSDSRTADYLEGRFG